MQRENKIVFVRFAEMIGLDGREKDMLSRYIELVESGNQRCNLISQKDLGRISEKHIIDSWHYCLREGVPENSTMLDIGSGAGFPGVVLALLRPDISIVLLESKNKKALFLQQVVTSLCLKNATVLCERAETLATKHCRSFDVITARAVADLSKLWHLARPLLKSTGWLLTQKGPKEKFDSSKELQVKRIPMIHSVSDSVLIIAKIMREL